MDISVSSQAYIFLYSILGGMAVSFIYDIFRIKRKRVKTRSIIIQLEDFLYWILVTLVMFALVYYSNEGEIRGYIFIGNILGVILYALVLSKFIIAVALKIIDLTVRVVKFIWTILTYPFRVVFKILSVPCKFILRVFKKVFRGARRAGRRGSAKVAAWKRAFRHLRKKI